VAEAMAVGSRAMSNTDSTPFMDLVPSVSLRENRRLSPHVSPERWQAVYLNALNLEARYQGEQAGAALVGEMFWGGGL